MNVDYLPQEGMEEYYQNPDLLIARAHKIRSELIVELFTSLKNRIVSCFN